MNIHVKVMVNGMTFMTKCVKNLLKLKSNTLMHVFMHLVKINVTNVVWDIRL